jgi:hypothetical protein
VGRQRSPASWHRFSPDRKGQHPKDHLANYQGWMHADCKDKSVFGKATRGSLSGEADGRAMIAKARIPPALTIAPMKGAASS